MSTKEFDYNECRQLEATAEAYGKHLDDIGIVMMKKNGEPVSWEEWVSITSFPLDHFGGGLAKRVSSHEAPF